MTLFRGPPGQSVSPNQVHREGELVLFGTVVIRRAIIGMLEAELGTDRDDVGNPMSKGDAVLGVERLVAGPLATEVIEKIVADRDIVALREFLLQVVHSGPLGS